MPKIKCREWRGEHAKYAHLKHDGHYTRVVKDDAGIVSAWSSLPTRLELPDRLLANVHRYVPCGTTLLGELTGGDQGRASDVKTALKAGTCELTYFAVEDTPEEGLPRPLAEMPLEWVADQMTAWGLPFAPFWTTPKSRETFDREMLLTWADEAGGEGVVLKDGNLLNWRKLKRVLTADLVCTGVTEGDGKFVGLIGSLVCADRTGRAVANVSGMTDDQRVDFTLEEPIGRVVEVAYQYVGAGGRLRHPRFVRIRHDKVATRPEDVTCLSDAS